MNGAIAKRVVTRALERAGHTSAMVADAKRQGRWWLEARSAALRRVARVDRGWTILWSPGGGCELVPIDVARAGSREVTIEVLWSSISPGTERAQFLRLPNAQVELPYRPGYSAAGRVVKAGRNVEGISAGDLVAAIRVPHASVATAPAHDVYKLPPGVRPEDAALLRLAIVAGYGLRRAQLAPGDKVVVVGAGAIGLLAQRLAVARGAAQTVMIARSRARALPAAAGGAPLLVAHEDALEIASLGADVVIEATGSPDAIATAVGAARPGGRVVLLGSPRGDSRDVPLAEIRRKGLELIGAHISLIDRERTADEPHPERSEGESYLAALSEGLLSVDDLIGDAVDPRESALVYRAIASDPTIVGARFDWQRLASRQRSTPATLRPPELSARGVDLARRPLLLPKPASASVPLDGPPVRLALVGCGDIAVKNAAAAHAAAATTLVTCFDPVARLADDLAHAHGCERAPSLDAVLDDDRVEAIFLSVPHHLHVPLALQAIAAGKHVIVEKPPANTLAGAVEMAAAARDAGVALSICFPHRYDPRIVELKKLIDAGVLGSFGGSMMSFMTDKPSSYWHGGFSGRSTSSWRTSREQSGGGVLIMNLSHYIDLIRHLVGIDASAVTAMAASVDAAGEVEDSVTVSIEYANGALGTLFGCSTMRGIDGKNELRLWGGDGQVSVEPEARVYSLRAVAGLRSGRWHAVPTAGQVDIRAEFLSHFAGSIRRGEPPEVSAADGVAVQAFIEAAYRSSESGRSVQLEEMLAEVYA